MGEPVFTGSWKLNRGKSAMRGQMPHDMLVHVQLLGAKLVPHVVAIADDATERNAVFHYDLGHVTPNTFPIGAMRSVACWLGSELLIESWMPTPASELHFKDYWSLSADANTLTMEHRDDDLAGQIAVLDRLP